MKRTRTYTIVVVTLILTMAVSVSWADKDKVVIEVKNQAKSDGEVTFVFTPAGGESQEIKVGVMNKMKASEIARDIMKGFSLALGDEYKVKMKDSQRVSIVANPKTKNEVITFDVVLGGNSVSGVSFVIK